MKSVLIKDTTKAERIELIRQWQEPEDGLEDCGIDLFDMYRDYIEGVREISEINAGFHADYYEEADLQKQPGCGSGKDRGSCYMKP